MIALLAAGSARAEIAATVDRTTVSEMDLLTLTVRLTDEDADETPDFSALEKDFEIISQSSRASSSITIVNDRQTSQSHVDWVLTLRPKRQGILTIPAIAAGTKQSEPITIKSVPANASGQQRGDRPVFFETSVDTTTAYVQGQIMYTVKLYYTGDISGDFPPPPELENAVVETVENERRYESIIDSQRYYVLERTYAIFPQQSGRLDIPRETFLGTRRVFNSRQRVSAVSKQHVIEVKP
ncbi:MAG: BatD family protein, partial [Pseudomonadales bacterium]|nr:BatD family protein [Pseudomonadales bacterium]